ncbi:lysophospholipid acyltransferase family protein [Methylotenera sp.]|uniref:lysophospholipid acyltransferase family protein n=1 Tax=Methylotenera sp. TaxID=2051956 RepID=UPI00273142BA|nr:lysophospholipid acyltransferase family protein [Methylotenera sp.]MDP2231587.1 lysophospholipid acyltransferase family protein [Methylotenera sp.]
MSKIKPLIKQALTTLVVESLKLLRFLPLPVIHGLGVFLGLMSYLFNKDHRDHAVRNLKQFGLTNSDADLHKLLFKSTLENSKGALETFAIWFKPHAKVISWVKEIFGWDAVEKALQSGKGVIFLTPHLGCFEITSLYYGSHHPMAVLYRQPRQKWLLPLITNGRERGQITLAPANVQGVKQLLQALKRGEAIGVLPDQAPLEGEGEWAPFFGRPAYTMTLASKFAQKSGAQVFMAFGERLSFGRGYNIHIRAVNADGIDTPTLLNAEIEHTIKQCPAQYLWMYDRYKVRNQPPPQTL